MAVGGTINVGTVAVRIDTAGEQWDGESFIFRNDGPNSVRLGGSTTASIGPAIATNEWSPSMSPGHADSVYAITDSGTAIIRVLYLGV